jgi:hypothetical protein
MGILTDDDSLVDAALSELLALPLERRHELDPRRDVNYLLIQHHLGQVGPPLGLIKLFLTNGIRMTLKKHYQSRKVQCTLSHPATRIAMNWRA